MLDSALRPERAGCAAPRHGTVSAYQRVGCRCADARQAARLYSKRRRLGRPEVRRLDATGTQRRVHALMALGHTAQTVGAAAGMSAFQVQQTTRRRWVSPRTATRIAAAYDRLCGTRGTSQVTRRRAVWLGWAPPLAWEDIDDPAERPKGVRVTRAGVG